MRTDVSIAAGAAVVAVVAAVMTLTGAQARAASASELTITEAPSMNAVPYTPKSVEIKMTNEGGTARFEPKDVTITAGDTVKFVQTGGSHNIKFWADSVPAASIPILKKAVSDSLVTPRYPTGAATFVLVTTGLAKGVHKFYCTPHLQRFQMAGSITVQ
jgi:plastocyanin